jgi:predicted GIY-YIG superfamily endonuclease
MTGKHIQQFFTRYKRSVKIISVVANYSEMSAMSTDCPCTLYRFYDSKGNLLYVGIADVWLNRLHQHRHTARWFRHISMLKLEHFSSRRDARAAENEAIEAEKPLYNIVNYAYPVATHKL